MKFVSLGKSDIAVPPIAIGTWQASGWANSDESTLIQIIRSAFDKGFNFIDTAESYGDGYSEEVVKKAIEKNRNSYIIATKFSYRNAKAEDTRKALEDSLRRLKTDYIDLYQYHWPSPHIPFNETIDLLKILKKEGKIRAIGVSNWMEPEFEIYDDYNEIDSVQNCYNLLWRQIENNVIPKCLSNKLSVLAYSPLAQGILAGRFEEISDLPKDPRRQNILLKEDVFPAVKKILSELKLMAQKYSSASFQVSLAQLSLAWLLSKEGVTSAIVGNTSIEQLNNNLSAADIKIEVDDILRLDEISWDLSKDRKPHDTLWGWHSCTKKPNPLK